MKLFVKMEGVLSRIWAMYIKLVTLNVPFVFLGFELVRISQNVLCSWLESDVRIADGSVKLTVSPIRKNSFYFSA